VAFLSTGDFATDQTPLPTEYATCPLLYFVLELADAFLDLQDHCCICRRQMAPGVKPLICDDPRCIFRYQEIGVGMSVVAEIKRDPTVADLLVSVFSAAIGTDFLTPSRPNYDQAQALEILQKLPAMAELMAKCKDDSALSDIISPPGLWLLRWVLCSNQSHLISLPPEKRLPQCPFQHQFMAILSSPEKEEIFNALKARVGSMYLWHGSRRCWGLESISQKILRLHAAILVEEQMDMRIQYTGLRSEYSHFVKWRR
jgi:hypothetical protein